MPAGWMLSSASSAADSPVADPAVGRISTGVVEPKLIRMVPIATNTTSTSGPVEAVVSMTVDKAGKTENLKIQKSVGPELDQEIWMR